MNVVEKVGQLSILFHKLFKEASSETYNTERINQFKIGHKNGSPQNKTKSSQQMALDVNRIL